MKVRTISAALVAFLTGAFCFAQKVQDTQYLYAYEQNLSEQEAVSFGEVWGYVMNGREYEFSQQMPVTDLCCFSADINHYGEISSYPDLSKFEGFKGRKHLVVTCESRSLSHLVLEPKFGISKKIARELAKASVDYDGIQIDFELVPVRDAENFRRFLKLLRSKLPKEKMLSVCVPARLRSVEDDVYSYTMLEPLADRIIVMAYDQHWSTSKSGPVAGMDWGERIAEYSCSVIPKNKIVMGMPFYGRTWVDENFGKAWYNSGVNRILNENGVKQVERKDGVPNFSFTAQVCVTGWFDDAQSLLQRCRLYGGMGIDNVAFWRIGQEDPAIWNYLNVDEKK